MNEAQIKIKRTESALEELIPMALSELRDERVNSLDIVAVRCSKGRYDATVYINGDGMSPHEKREALSQIKKCTGYINEYCLASEGWFRMPKLTFCFDDTVQKGMKLEAIFNTIKKSDNGTSENN